MMGVSVQPKLNRKCRRGARGDPTNPSQEPAECEKNWQMVIHVHLGAETHISMYTKTLFSWHSGMQTADMNFNTLLWEPPPPHPRAHCQYSMRKYLCRTPKRDPQHDHLSVPQHNEAIMGGNSCFSKSALRLPFHTQVNWNTGFIDLHINRFLVNVLLHSKKT